MSIQTFNEVSIADLRKIFKDNGLEYLIKKQKGNVVKVCFLVNDDE